MKKLVALFVSIAALNSSAVAYDVVFHGVNHQPVYVEPEKNTGLDAIYVVYDISSVSSMEISGFSSSNPTASRYSNLGGGYAEPVQSSFNGGTMSIASPAGDMGYIITDGDRNFCLWVVNYADHKLNIQTIQPSSEQDCESTVLDVTGEASPIHYFSINGQQRTLSRDLNLSYYNLEWNADQKNFENNHIDKVIESVTDRIMIMPPVYCSTEFTLSGDRFLDKWGLSESIQSSTFVPHSVAVMTEAVQAGTGTDDENAENASNQINTETEGLGGSAPADITFYGYCTDAVLHTEWQMSSDPDFESIIYRFNEQDLSYTFNEEGQFYLRFIGSNADGSCEAYGDVYTVSIGASDIRIPNAFSPDGDGTNDEWKVAYRSLISFKCWIFDRHGQQLFYFDRPELGWDGKYKGKLVNPGAYYYVIEAQGADGKKYKKSGDINILTGKKYGESTSTPVE